MLNLRPNCHLTFLTQCTHIPTATNFTPVNLWQVALVLHYWSTREDCILELVSLQAQKENNSIRGRQDKLKRRVVCSRDKRVSQPIAREARWRRITNIHWEAKLMWFKAIKEACRWTIHTSQVTSSSMLLPREKQVTHLSPCTIWRMVKVWLSSFTAKVHRRTQDSKAFHRRILSRSKRSINNSTIPAVCWDQAELPNNQVAQAICMEAWQSSKSRQVHTTTQAMCTKEFSFSSSRSSIRTISLQSWRWRGKQ